MRTQLVRAWLGVCLALSACHNGASGTGDGGSADLASTSGNDAAAGTALTAPSETWTWIPFDNAFCGDGSTTGIGVNLSTKSSRVQIYLEGGGACWDATTCYTLMTAANFKSGYGETNFQAETTQTLNTAFFDRTDAANPFKDYSYIYVPYCTGDVHAGSNVATYGTMQAHHVGYQNMTAFLARIVPTFPSAERVYLTGSSAGGFGALYNWGQTQKAFGSVRVDVIDDSGTLMPPDVLATGNGSDAIQRTSWNLAATIPPGCTACATDQSALYGYYAATFPNQHAALLSYEMDSVLPTFSGITQAEFGMGLSEDINNQFSPHPNLRYFLVAGPGHVLLFQPQLTTKSVTLETWLTQMTSDDAAWASLAP